MIVVLLVVLFIAAYFLYDEKVTKKLTNSMSADSQSQMSTGTETTVDLQTEKIKFVDVEVEKDLFVHEFTVLPDSDDARTYLHTDATDGLVYCFSGEEDKAIIYLNESDEVMFVVKTDGVNKLGHESGSEYNLTQLGIEQNELDYWSAVIKNNI